MRKLKRTTSKAARLTITLGDDQRREIESIARERRTSSATVIRWAIDQYISEQGHGTEQEQSERERAQ
jgi:predicted transcriptional regulator